jgi:hypothetical protein
MLSILKSQFLEKIFWSDLSGLHSMKFGINNLAVRVTVDDWA